jgi:hypothetical protein
MLQGRVASAAWSFFVVTSLSGCGQLSPAASSQTPPENVAARVKTVFDPKAQWPL